jgi:hypothetical protein
MKRLWFLLLIVSYLLLSYYALGGWWNSSAGTLLIILFSYQVWHKDFSANIGLRTDLKTVIVSIAIAAVVTLCSFLVMKHIATAREVIIQLAVWKDYYHDIFYTLNEEIVLGAIILFWLTRRKKIRQLWAATGLALAFALIHYVFYKWIFLDSGIIGITALVTLFLVGFLRNSLILVTGHVGYSWAIHFGWMAVMFGSNHINVKTGITLHDYEKFNLYLGSPLMVVITALLAASALVYLIRNNPQTGRLR